MAKWIYEKRNIDTVDEVVDNLKTISSRYSFYDNKTYGISQNTPYPVASYSKNGLYYTDRSAFSGEMGAEFLVYNDRIVSDPPAGMGFSYKIKKTMTSVSEVKGILYRATTAKGSLIELVTAEEGTLPDDGIQDGYWYVKLKKAMNFKYKDQNGTVYDIAKCYYKNSDGVVQEISEIKYKDDQGVVR